MNWWLAVPAAAALVARLITGPRPIDDAYITFRYARNLGEGLGLVYNPGEWVLGTTAPLWSVLLGIGYRIGLTDLPWLATVLSGMCDAASAALLTVLSRRAGLSLRGAVLIGLVWAINPMSISFAVGGMETSLFVLLALRERLHSARRRVLVPGGCRLGVVHGPPRAASGCCRGRYAHCGWRSGTAAAVR
jgi:arabinofuranosyltransferase